MAQYRGSEAKLISAREAKVITGRHQIRRKEIEESGVQYIEAEFFGIKTFKKLLAECEGKAVGFRIYYGLQDEDHEGDEPQICAKGEGKPTPRLVIVPVDAHGVDLTGLISVGGHKDMPSDGNAMANGPVCPRHC